MLASVQTQSCELATILDARFSGLHGRAMCDVHAWWARNAMYVRIPPFLGCHSANRSCRARVLYLHAHPHVSDFKCQGRSSRAAVPLRYIRKRGAVPYVTYVTSAKRIAVPVGYQELLSLANFAFLNVDSKAHLAAHLVRCSISVCCSISVGWFSFVISY